MNPQGIIYSLIVQRNIETIYFSFSCPFATLLYVHNKTFTYISSTTYRKNVSNHANDKASLFLTICNISIYLQCDIMRITLCWFLIIGNTPHLIVKFLKLPFVSIQLVTKFHRHTKITKT
jgi:hypothetical protein